MIVYRTDHGSISHVGLLDDKGLVISKWSWGPLIRHRIWDVPDHYGETIEFYKMNGAAVLKIQNARNEFYSNEK